MRSESPRPDPPSASSSPTNGTRHLTYLLDGRGDEMVGGIYSYLDITPLGRQEEWEDSPEGYPQGEAHSWVKLHDEYDGSGS